MKISWKTLRALAPICASDGTARHALANVRIEREGVEHLVAVASNGKSMLAVKFPCPLTDQASEDPKLLVPSATIAALEAASQASGIGGKTGTTIDRDDGGGVAVRLTAGGVTITAEAKPPDGFYPCWRDWFLPDDEAAALPFVRVDPRRLAALLTAIADAATDEESAAVLLAINPGAQRTIAVEIRAATPQIEAAALLCGMISDRRCTWRPSKASFAPDPTPQS